IRCLKGTVISMHWNRFLRVVGWTVFGMLLAACTAGASASPKPPAEFTPITAIAPTTTAAVPSSTSTTTTIPEPTSTTPTVAEPAVPTPEVKQRLVISGTGDVNLDPSFVRSFPSTGYEYAWSGLDDIFNQDDLTVINLECSASNLGTPWNKPWTFRCDPEALPSMAAAGVDVANLANNHAMDYGFDAMLDARSNLMKVGIEPVGAGADAAEAYEPVIIERNGWTIAILGGGGVHPETGSWIATDDRPGMTDGDSAEAMTEAIRAADEIADLVLVTIHWGEQGTIQPRAFEIRLAEAFIDAGADGVFGHHQHVLQPLGWYSGKPIAWGLGNFVWQAGSTLARTTAVAQFVFEPDGRIGACLVPVVIEATGHPVLQPGYEGPCAPDGATQ
ncbi:MAG: CapA family protein, partial [Actinomycetota bacterium]|nr:CapA family protein [Actinomycetota bacterium]